MGDVILLHEYGRADIRYSGPCGFCLQRECLKCTGRAGLKVNGRVLPTLEDWPMCPCEHRPTLGLEQA